MLRRSLWVLAMGVVLLAVTVTVPVATALASNLGTTRVGANPYSDPDLVSMFDGTTLSGWTASKPGGGLLRMVPSTVLVPLVGDGSITKRVRSGASGGSSTSGR
ncbi:MAG TPA: hypothetical protein VHV10_11965 [Ktedonobacteraceae bacterium]|nr:hypothetical protein [Ktedonobacteraceae bacterium]